MPLVPATSGPPALSGMTVEFKLFEFRSLKPFGWRL